MNQFTTICMLLSGTVMASLQRSSSDSPSFATPTASPLSRSKRIPRPRYPTPPEKKKEPARVKPRKIPVDLSAIWVDPETIKIARTIYKALGFRQILDVPDPSEERLMGNILFLSIVGPNDDYKVYNQGTKSAMEHPYDDILNELMTGVRRNPQSQQPRFHLYWYAKMQHVKKPERVYYYTLEAIYTVHRPDSATASLRSSRSLSRSSQFTSPEATDDDAAEDYYGEDRYRAIYKLERVDACVSEKSFNL